MSHMNFFYIRNRDRHPVGVGMVRATKSRIKLSVSLCAPYDTFDKEVGLRLARERMYLSWAEGAPFYPRVATMTRQEMDAMDTGDLCSFVLTAITRAGRADTLRALDISVHDQYNPLMGCLYYAEQGRGAVAA